MSRIRHNQSQFSLVVFLAIVFALAVPVVTVAQYYNFGNPSATETSTAPSTTPSSGYPVSVYPTSSYPASASPASPPTVGQYAGQTVPTTLQSNPATQSPTQGVVPIFNPSQLPNNDTSVSMYPGEVVSLNDMSQVYLDGTGFAYQPHTGFTFSPEDQPISASPTPISIPAFDPTAGGNVHSVDIPAFQPPQFTPFSPTPQGGEELVALGGVGNAYHNPYIGTGQTSGAVPAFQPPGVQESPANQGLVVRERERRDDRRQADQQYIDTYNEIKDKKNTEAWKIRMPPYAGPLENRGGNGQEEPAFIQASYLTHQQDDYEYDWEREEKHYFSFSMLDPTRFAERAKVWVGLGPDEEKARKHLENAMQLMKNGENIKAAKEFEWAAYYWKDTAVEEDARYHAAECYYREKRFNDAVKQYTKLLVNFPSSPYKTEAIKNTFEIARTWIKQVTEDRVSYVNFTDRSRPTFDTFGYAEKALKTIYTNCPSDPMADDSVFLLAHGYMRLGRAQGDASFEHAAEYFKQLRDFYPNSEFVVEAMRLEVICRQKASLGPDYDARHIDEAIRVADQLRLQHRTRMPSDQQNELLQITNRLNEEKAEKLWITAKFYDDGKNYGSARLQYRKIITDYPTTEYAEKARVRYEKIRDLPAELPSDWERIKSVLWLNRK